MTKITKRLYDRLVEVHGKKNVDEVLKDHKLIVIDERAENGGKD